jgi:GDPmannose 4,6-dehydratase
LSQGDASKAEKVFGWKPTVKFDELVRDMMDSDIKLMQTRPEA